MDHEGGRLLMISMLLLLVFKTKLRFSFLNRICFFFHFCAFISQSTFFSNGILRKTKYVAAKHNGMQMMQRRSHFATGYSASEVSSIETGMMIIG